MPRRGILLNLKQKVEMPIGYQDPRRPDYFLTLYPPDMHIILNNIPYA